jgi:quercetin dioxygenase-like cupin family protein
MGNLRTRFVPFTLAGLAIVATISLAQQQGGGFLSNFTGEIAIVPSDEMRSSRIRFEAGARTNWHVHSEPQLLLIEEGRGRWQEEGGPVQVLESGEPVLTRASLNHWHGAAPDQFAMQFSVYSGSLDWGDPVSEEDYLGQ